MFRENSTPSVELHGRYCRWTSTLILPFHMQIDKSVLDNVIPLSQINFEHKTYIISPSKTVTLKMTDGVPQKNKRRMD